MRHPLRRPLDPRNAASEIARPLARILDGNDPDLTGATGLVATIEEPVVRPELRAHLENEDFVRRLRWELGAHFGDDRVLPDLHVRYAAGDAPALLVTPDRGPATSARLDWGAGRFDIDGSKALLAVGRGPIRKRYPGARNDVVLDERFNFVSRDAFALRWDPGRAVWRLEIDDPGRRYLEIRRRGSVLVPQLASIPLDDGDVIALTAGQGSADRLEIHFSIQEG
jgi:hypothetical protein